MRAMGDRIKEIPVDAKAGNVHHQNAKQCNATDGINTFNPVGRSNWLST